jgi:hypothetical protein
MVQLGSLCGINMCKARLDCISPFYEYNMTSYASALVQYKRQVLQAQLPLPLLCCQLSVMLDWLLV